MTKIFALMSLTFYFFAVLFGLILFTGRYHPAAPAGEKGKSEEVESERTKALAQKVKRLEEEIASKRKELVNLQEQIDQANQTIEQLRAEIAALSAEKRSLEQGQSLAKLYNAMQPEEVASLLSKADSQMIDMIVKYAFPYMREKNVGKIMSALTKSDPQVAIKITQILARIDEESRKRQTEESL